MTGLEQFTELSRQWFVATFQTPTRVQVQAWDAIANDENVLVVAPTGSGKTLAAFFHAIDRLHRVEKLNGSGTRVVYISPLKALGVDVERNLREPLHGIQRVASQLGVVSPVVSVGIRSGDTSPTERTRLVRRPPDILITTPESLYLMLTSRALETLRDVQTVIVDEIHAVVDTKRGTHLALSLERLDALVGRDVQRIALSATVRPIDKVAAFLGGDRPVRVVAPEITKRWDVHVRLPVADIAKPGPPPPAVAAVLERASSATPEQIESIWPHVELAIYDTVMANRSTLVFANARRVAERLTSRLNEIWASQHDPESLSAPARRPPAQVMSPSDEVGAAPTVIARAHHGSVSKEARAQIESQLKSGELRCVVATSSLELGIDMGAVERVIQVSAPPSIASTLQRIGRAGHQVGAVSHGDVYPIHRGDLVPSAVATLRMLAGEIEAIKIPAAPLDVLAQQTVAASVAAADFGLPIDDWYAIVQRAMPYHGLDRRLFDAVLELLTGAYPGADFGYLRARLVRSKGRLHARPGAQRLAMTSGGTIPDRGLFGVFLAEGDDSSRRVGELDEEMVYESRPGDVFTLGASSWRIVEITRDQVRVVPAPGHTGRLPFWHGDSKARPAELGVQIGRFHKQALRNPDFLDVPVLDDSVKANIVAYLTQQRDATGQVSDDTTIVVERFRDEVGDWRFVLHYPLGRAVLAPWALAIGASLREVTAIDVAPTASDDGIIWRMPDCDAAERITDHLLPHPDEISQIVTDEVGGTALFAARFRECAARALLLPGRGPGRRSPLWQQRHRAAQLLEVAREHTRFPIIIETAREVLTDVYDLPGLTDVLRQIRRGSIRVVEVTTSSPSPFAAGMLMQYTAEFMYAGDMPLAERRAAVLSMDPSLLAAALGTIDLRDLLDSDVIAEVEAELQRTTSEYRARDADEIADLTRTLGPIPLDSLPDRITAALAADSDRIVESLAGRCVVIEFAGSPHLVAVSDLGLLRDALGVLPPPGAPQPLGERTGRDPLTQLFSRYARTHAPFLTEAVAAAFGLSAEVAQLILDQEVVAKHLVVGNFTPGRIGVEYADPDVLRRIRNRSLAAARAQIQPVSASGLARFIAAWHGVDDPPPSSPDEVLIALQRLAGIALPASTWETQILPARVRGYSPTHLDELLAEGEVVIRLRGSAGAADPLIALVPVADIDLVQPPEPVSPELQEFALEVSNAGGLFSDVRMSQGAHTQSVTELVELWWRTCEAGLIAPVSMAPIRARIGASKRSAPKSVKRTPRGRVRLPRPGRALLMRPTSSETPPVVAGRWYLVRDPELTPVDRSISEVSGWLERHGVITRRAVQTDSPVGGFASAYRMLSELEQAGKVSRGYIVEGLGGSQFATPDVIDQIRTFADAANESALPSGTPSPTAIGLGATDPANPYGLALPWPNHPIARPTRTSGAVVVLADGLCLGYLTRSGKSLTVFEQAGERAPARSACLSLIGQALQQSTADGRMSRVHITEIDGERASFGADADALLKAGAHLTPRGVVFEGRRP